jgi:hypothetical protein
MALVEAPGRIRDAKIFLACRIADEAEREGLPLTEIERKMLYDAEDGWTLDDIHQVRALFAEECDRGHYEKRMIRLIRRLRARLRAAREGDEYEGWKKAVRELRGEDHYLSQLIARAGPQGEVVRLIVTAIVVIGVMLIAIFLATGRY